MRINKLIVGIMLGVPWAALSVHAQSFHNLAFEQANPVIDPEGTYYPLDVTAASALPGWAVYVGTVPQTDVIQNAYSYGLAGVDIFGPNYPTTGPGSGIGTIDGKYSVVLQAGAVDPPENDATVSASIEQYGTVSPGSQSLQFLAWTTPSTEFSISFAGNNLTPVALGSGPNYTTLYGVNISPYAGDSGTLEFSALFNYAGSSWLGLDDITFSPNAVPEPSIVVLTGMGGLLFGARKWFVQR